MKSQGEVDAQYDAAHSYILQVQDEISQVLDGFLSGQTNSSSRPPNPSPAPPSASTIALPSAPTLAPPSAPTLALPSAPALALPSAPTLAPPSSPALVLPSAPTLAPPSAPTLAPPSAPALAPPSASTLTPPSAPALALPSAPALAPPSAPTLAPPSAPTLAPPSAPTLVPPSPLPHLSGPPFALALAPPPAPTLALSTALPHLSAPPFVPGLVPPSALPHLPAPPFAPELAPPSVLPQPPAPPPIATFALPSAPTVAPACALPQPPAPSPLSTFAPPSAPELAPPSALPQPLAPPLSSTFALPSAPSSTLALSPAFASPSAPAPPSAASSPPAPPSALFSPTSPSSAPLPVLAVTSATTPGCICPPRDTANASRGSSPQSHVGVHDVFGKQPDVEEVTSTKSTSQEDGTRSWAGGGGGGRGGGGGGGGGRDVADKKPSVEDVTSTRSTSGEDGARTGAAAGGCRDFASKKRRLDDVTNTHNTGHKGRQIVSARKEPKTAKRHFRPCSSGSRFSNYDADLYWTGRKISVEGSGKDRPKKGHGQGRDLCVFVGGRRRSTGDSEGSRRVKDAGAAVDRASRRNSGDKPRKEQDGHDINTFDRRRDDIEDVKVDGDVDDVTQTDNVEGVTQGDDVGNVTQIDNVEDIRHGDDADGVMQDDGVEDVRQDDDADHVTHNDGVEDARHGVGVETHASAHRRRTSSEGSQTVQQPHDDPVGRSDGSNTRDTGRRASAEVPDGERHKEKKAGRQLPHGDCPVAQDVLQSESRRKADGERHKEKKAGRQLPHGDCPGAQDVLQSESRRKADGRERLTATTHRQGAAPQRKEQQHDLTAPNKRGHDSLKAAKSSGEGSSPRSSGVAESLCCVLHKHQTEDDTAQTTYYPAKGHQHCSRDKGQAHGKYQSTPEVVLSFRDGSVGPQARYSAGASESLKGFRDAVKVPSGSPGVAGTRQLPPGAAETTRSSSGVADTTHVFRDTVEASEAFRDTVEAPEAFRDTSRAPGASWDTVQAPEGCWSPAEGVSSFQGAERGPAGGSSRRGDAAEDVFLAASTSSRGQKNTSLRDTALMTVCDQAVHLPLPPQPDHAEDQPPAPPAAPLHPAPAPRRVAKDCADPGVPDDPAPPGARANATPALNFPQPQARPGPRGQDEVRQLCHGGALPEGERAGGVGEDPEASVELPEQQRAPGSRLRRASSPEGSEGELPVRVPGTGGRSVGSVQASAMPDLREAAGKEGTRHAPASGSGSRPPEPAGGVCSQRDSLQCQGGVFGSLEGQDEHLVQGPAAGAQSRDAEVQTVADGALTRAHLTPLVETACQTGGRPAEEPSSDRAASRRDRVDRKADTARSASRSAKRPTELHVHSGGQRGSLGDGRAKVGGGKSSRSASRPKPRGAGKDKRDAPQEDVQSFNGQARVPLPPARSEQQSRQTEASGFRQREREQSARVEQEPLDLSPGAGELQASLRPTETPAAAVVAVVRRKRPDKKPDQSCRDDGKDKEAGSQQHGPADSTKRHGVHGELHEPRDPGKNHAKHSVRAADDDDGEKDEEVSAGAGNFSFRPDEVPEMQVMVNSLTPVLQRRRSAARRSNSHTGASSSSSAAGTPCTEDQLHRLLASFAASAESPERVEVDLPEPRRQAGRSSAKAKASREQTPDHRHESGAVRASEVSGGSLFIKPKFARTWHGPVQAGSGRAAAPRMGVAMMTSDAASLTLGHGARAGGPGGGGGVGSHVHTMPVISRTLLDALHKRYCSYQYSSGGWSPHAAPLPPPAPPAASLTLHLPPQLASAPLKKLNSEGESDTGSSAPTSTQSSPRTLHTLGEDAGGGGGGGDGGDHEGQASPDSSPATEQKRNGRGKEEEIEAIEACQWLRAAGFPQYAQMFEDGLFPLDTWDVQRDHDFLDSDSIQSVIRRLNILNTCAVMKIDAQPSKKATEESDEEDLCALSDRWEYQKTVRRWSRKGPDLTLVVDSTLEPSSSHDSLLGEESGSHTDDSPMLDSKMPHTTAVTTSGEQAPDSSEDVLGVEPPEPLVEGLIPPSSQGSSFPVSPKLRRAASERLKSALKKMESFKKKSKKYPMSRNIVEISDPVVADQEEMQAKLQHLNCVDISPNGVGPTPIAKRPSLPVGESTPMDKVSHGIASPDSSSLSPISPASPVVPPPAADAAADSSASSQTDSSSLSEYYTAHTQLLANFQACSSSGKPLGGSLGGRKSSDSSLVEIFLLPQDHKPGSFPRLLKNGYIDTAVPFQASLPAPQVPPSGASLPRDPQGLRGSLGHKGGAKSAASRVSVYDNFPAVGSPQHSAEGNKALEDRLDARLQLGRQSQAVRSLSISSSGSGAKLEAESSETGGMVRSLSASAATSMEFQASSSRASLASDYLGSLRGSTARKSSLAMDEFDAILQNLYQDISNLSRSIGQDEEQEHDLDIAAVRCGSTPSREVTFSITEQNGDIGDHSVDNSTSGSIKLETQLSQTSASETDSFRLGPLSPVCVDDSMEGEEGDLCSQTTSSQDSSDDVEGSADDTLERIALGARERRDSGVGSSLTRASSERKRKKIRWESFQKCHRPSRASRELQIGGLSVCQLLPLRQLSLLKLTSIMEKCSPTNRSQWSWSVPRFMKRNKAPHFSDKNVFGVPFTIMLQRTGQPLPQCVLYAMRYLRKTSHDALGIFRKSGVRSRIQKLRDLVESNPDSINFDELQPYDVADLLKQYFRELPECLLTNKLSDTFRSIFTHVPQSQRLEALQTAVILLPEENREVLHCLLLFLGDIAQHADKHQMNASNLAVCFAPSLFNFLGGHGTNSPRRQRKTPGVPEQRELLEQKAVHECFTYMITDCKKLFMVPPSMYSRLHLSTLSNMEPVHLDEFYAKSKQPGPDFKAFGEEHIQMLLKEVHDKARGWVPATVGVPGIEVLHRKPQDGHPLRQWKCSVEIEAPPVEVLNRILHERHKWDDDMLSWDVVERLDRNSDVFHYVLNTMAPHPPRHFMVIRYWRPDLVKGACALVSKSVEHSGALAASAEYDQGVRAVELGSFYLMEPCGSGRSRLTYISRTDLRGRCPEWYNRVFGHMCANFLDRLRDSFRQEADGPETKV